MTDAGLAVNTLLSGLLVGALAVGWRLARRLRALVTAHEAFVRSVAELDAAAVRAERILASFRSEALAAAEALSSRIAKAEQLASRLQRLQSEVEAADERRSQSGAPAHGDRGGRIKRLQALARRPSSAPDAGVERVEDDIFEPAGERRAG